jgi:REP element-mobilizing transposase RayT
MGIEHGYKIRNKVGIHFVTFAMAEWVYPVKTGQVVFTRKAYCDIVIDSIKHCQKEKGLIVYCWCLMSNHIHLAIASKDNNTSDILRDFKKYTSKKTIEAIQNNQQESRREWMLNIFEKAGEANSRNKTYQFWQKDNLLNPKFATLDSPIIQNSTDSWEKYYRRLARRLYQ